MGLLKSLIRQTEKIDFLFPNDFDELMNNNYYDYDKFEWFLYYVFKLDGHKVDKVGKKGRGDGGADLIITVPQEGGGLRRIGIQAKYWKYRVGTEPINQLASAKSRHTLTDLWIITTSDLTSDAKDIAESMEIKILRAEDVAALIESIKERYEEDIEKDGESAIEFLQRDVKLDLTIKKPKKHTKTESVDIELEKKLKELRLEIAKKYKLFPVYNVFNNETLKLILTEKPKTKEKLAKIKGLGEKKIETFGNEVLDFINKNFPENNKTDKNEDEELVKLLIKERPKIARFNKLKEKEVYSDRVAGYLAKMKPRTKENLKKIYNFREENIEIFGDYLLRVIATYIDKK